MAREVVEPVMGEDGYEEHPAWVLVAVHRVQSTGTHLFDSDVAHRHYMAVSVRRASRKRSLHNDYIHPRQEIIEFKLSEAQWASLVSSPNSGSGVPATLSFDLSQEDPRVPDVPFEPRLAESLAEVHGAAKRAVEEVHEAFETYKAHKTAANLRTLQARIDNLPSNLRFAAESLSGHAENVVTRAKADIEAFVVNHAEKLGLKPGEIGMPELTVGDEA